MTPRLLNGTLQAHDVNDLEGLVRRALADELRTRRATLPPDAEEDAIAYLLTIAWQLSQRYDPTRSHLTFSGYCYPIVRRRLSDWYRSHYGDTRYTPRPQPVPLTDALAEALPTRQSDHETDRYPALDGLHPPGDRPPLWTADQLDPRPASRTTRRTRATPRRHAA